MLRKIKSKELMYRKILRINIIYGNENKKQL